MVSVGEEHISLDKGLIIPKIPHSISLIESVKAFSGPRSVCQYQGQTFVGQSVLYLYVFASRSNDSGTIWILDLQTGTCITAII